MNANGTWGRNRKSSGWCQKHLCNKKVKACKAKAEVASGHWTYLHDFGWSFDKWRGLFDFHTPELNQELQTCLNFSSFTLMFQLSSAFRIKRYRLESFTSRDKCLCSPVKDINNPPYDTYIVLSMRAVRQNASDNCMYIFVSPDEGLCAGSIWKSLPYIPYSYLSSKVGCWRPERREIRPMKYKTLLPGHSDQTLHRRAFRPSWAC